MNADLNHDRLRRILQQGDPAAGDPGLTAEEVHTLRRTVLTAIPEPRPRRAWLPALAAGTAVLIVLALAAALGPWRRPAAPRAEVQVAADPAPAAPSVPPAVSAAPAITIPPPAPGVPVKSSRPALRRPVRALRTLPVRPNDAPVLTASLPVREIQFSTPGGTRVIWELSAKDIR
ncbi:MAG TPA: hypothetical protein VF173_02730 [Thermoanaerobaculia bacterium]|nr:hypothetical protein [Thermoanaerobaculia bacterium]